LVSYYEINFRGDSTILLPLRSPEPDMGTPSSYTGFICNLTSSTFFAIPDFTPSINVLFFSVVEAVPFLDD
jgi:hypothetical protein